MKQPNEISATPTGNFPQDILLQIFSYLSSGDLVRASVTSRFWRESALKMIDKKLLSRLTKLDFNQSIEKKIFVFGQGYSGVSTVASVLAFKEISKDIPSSCDEDTHQIKIGKLAITIKGFPGNATYFNLYFKNLIENKPKCDLIVYCFKARPNSTYFHQVFDQVDPHYSDRKILIGVGSQASAENNYTPENLAEKLNIKLLSFPGLEPQNIINLRLAFLAELFHKELNEIKNENQRVEVLPDEVQDPEESTCCSCNIS